MKEDQTERDLTFAVGAVQQAGARLLGLRKSGRWTDPRALADIGDQAADGFLQGLIQGRYPNDGVLSEETADTNERLGKARCWIVDPLDGTREFGEGRSDWAVHVALTYQGEPALAAVALPARGLVLKGCSLPGRERAEVHNDNGAELRLGNSSSPRPMRIAVSRTHPPDGIHAFRELLGRTHWDGKRRVQSFHATPGRRRHLCAQRGV